MSSQVRIACLGDSLTMGFQSGAIHAARSEWSYPALIARSMGLEVPVEFRVPRVPGPGLPLDIEGLLAFIQRKTGPNISRAEWIVRFPLLAREYIDRVEDYYERGGGTLPSNFSGIYHNLAVWGLTVREAIGLTPDICDEVIAGGDGFIDDDFLGTPSSPMYRTARRVLASAGRDASPLVAFERLCATEEVDVVLLWLGANDCLRTVLTLEVHDMRDAVGPIPDDPIARVDWNLTSTAVFARDYDILAGRVRTAAPNAKVFVATIPKVTIPPITAGIGRREGGYFEYYCRFFVDGGNFNGGLKHLTREQVHLIDARIGDYNAVIRRAAANYGFHLVDIAEILSLLAVKRNGLENSPDQPLRDYYRHTPNHPLLSLSPVPNALNFTVDKAGKRTGGGLFSLDGVHPTTLGYGIVAEAFLRVMQQANVVGADPDALPWSSLIAHDTLEMSAPSIWNQVMDSATEHATLWDLMFRAMS